MADWFERANEVLLPTYDRIPVHFNRGEGPYLFDDNGRRYLDALAGIAVNILGYRHPRLVDAGREAVDDIQHVSNLFQIESQYRLAEMLRQRGFEGRAFFCNSGAEANEAAIKFARKFQYRRDRSATTILSFQQSFHGRTLGALASTGQTKYQEGFGPMPEGFDYLPYNDPDVVSDRVNEDVAAVIVEPIQGEGGVIPAEDEFLTALRTACDDTNALLIFDEIQAGMGRTGSFYAFQQYDVQPDILTMAKGIANGYPMGVMMAHERLEGGFQPGDHASTFGGNPFVTRMGCAVLKALEQERVLDNVEARSRQLREGLMELSRRYDHVEPPRGRGLMLGLPLGDRYDASELMHSAREEGLIVGTAGENVLRFVPPLILTEENVVELLEKLDRSINTYEPG